MSSSSLAPSSPTASPSKAAKPAKLSPSKIKGGVKKIVKGLRRSVSKLHLRTRSDSHAAQAPVSIAHSEARRGALTSTSTIIIPVLATVPITVPVSPRHRYSSNSLARSYAKKASSDDHSSRDDTSSTHSQPPVSPISLVSSSRHTRSRSSSYSYRSSPTSSVSEDIPPVPPLPPSIIPKRAPTPGPTPTIEAFLPPPASIPAAITESAPEPIPVKESVVVPIPAEEPIAVPTPVEEPISVPLPVEEFIAILPPVAEEAQIPPVVEAPVTELAAPVPIAEADTPAEELTPTLESSPLPIEEASPATTPEVEVETEIEAEVPVEVVAILPIEEVSPPPVVEQVILPVVVEEPEQVPTPVVEAEVAIEEQNTPTEVEESIMVDQPVTVPAPVEEPAPAPEPPVVEEQVAVPEVFTPSSQTLAAPVVVEPEVPDPFIIDDTDQPLSEDSEEAEEEEDALKPETEDVSSSLVVSAENNDVSPAAPADVPLPPEDDIEVPVIPSVVEPEEESSSPESDVPEDEIALTQSISVQPSPQPPTSNAPALTQSLSTSSQAQSQPQIQIITPSPSALVDKPLPAPAPNVIPSPIVASSEEDEDEEDDYEIILPGVNAPTMFLPIPNTDPLTTLLTKYISPDKRPQRDLTGEWQRSEFHTLVMTNSWRALARMARDRIVAADPEDTSLILSLWYLRLSSLARLRLFNQTSAELTNLYTILTSPSISPSTSAYLFEKLVPFELEVLKAKVKYWSGDQMAYVDELTRLIMRCKVMSRKACTGLTVKVGTAGTGTGTATGAGAGTGTGAGEGKGKKVKARDEVAIDMWKERGTRDYAAATILLTPLLSPPKGTPRSPNLVSSIARIYLQSGLLRQAAKLFLEVNQDPSVSPSLKATNAALVAAAEGDWERATSMLRSAVNEDEDNVVAVNNLAVALLSQGHLKEGIDLLEGVLKTSPSTITTAEPILFNLSTLYELRSNTAADKKRELLIEVAKWAGDGLRTTCLKMPSA
ncbi:hypothetical protein NLI96_g7781 [Meripilus lineatus]|uniref:TPR-like protein n=1 Tax=Meripilus lineatus TaxID=2056292 RepID=A0AAD5YEL0_9APHY|nr:hypothetical protein NLI96_g7781 [Physisporinus lineatus]